jgi:Fe-S oxidoreductase
MWMEEKIGTRINVNRTEEAVQTLQLAGAGDRGAIATGCPFCRVMLSDGLTGMQADGSAAESVEVLDVAQLLLESVRREA